MIQLDRLAKTYGDRRVVDGLSLTVERGEFCVLIGSSGCGKSTTLKMVNRLVPMTEGTVRIAGRDVTAEPVAALRRGIGYAIQSTGLFPHWTVEDNIATVPRLLEWPERRIRDRVLELLALMQLDPEAYRLKRPHQLSGGEQQRVGVARALAADPDILLMDEPFGAVDPLTRGALQAMLASIHKATGKTILFVTHDIDEALLLADRIAIMDRGRLVQVGTPLELLERPADRFVEEFVGRKDLGLRLLSVRRIADRLRPDETADGPPIDRDAPLAVALSEMIARGTDRLPVQGPDGPVGVVLLGDLVR
jgi:osmoprotectant transport system ATP-binding protein